MIKILIVEDEISISKLMEMSLKRSGYQCDCAYDGEEALEKISRNIYDLILLDVMLPKIDGFELMEYIRPLEIPVIFITAKDSVNNRLKGLRMGAEDYIVKPFEIIELLARVDVVLRRFRLTDEVMDICGLHIDLRSMQVTRNGREIPLTKKEYDLLLLFTRNPNTALYRETIYERVWSGEFIQAAYTLQMSGETEMFSESENIEDTLRQIAGQRGSYWDSVALSGGDGVVYSQGKAAEYLTRAEERGNEESCVVTSFRTDDGSVYIRVSGGFSSGDQTMYLEAGHDISSLYEKREYQQKIYRIIFVTAMIICAVFSYGMSYLLTRSLSVLAKGAREISGGNLSFRTNIRSGDEIGSLSKDFDRMSEQIETNVRELEQAVERQERFVGSFTHELKTPMTAVIGYADLLRSQQLTEEERRDAAGYIFSEGRRLERLSMKLLDIYVAEKTDVRLSIHSPGRIAENMAEHLRPVFEKKKITLKGNYEKGKCLLEPDLLRSLTVNLIDNASKAAGEGGHIWVAVRMTDEDCVLCVDDDGPGIPEEAREHLTEAFYRVDKSRSRKQGGAGLGLTLCAEIVKLYGGTLVFKRRRGGGTRVIAELRGGRYEK